MGKVFDPAGVEMFKMFSFDCGKLFGDDSLDGVPLYEFRPVQRSGVVDNFEAMSREELIERQNKEKRARIEQMRAVAEVAMEAAKSEEFEETGETDEFGKVRKVINPHKSLSEYLPQTVWNKPQREGTPQE
jgi:hypothetical protein